MNGSASVCAAGPGQPGLPTRLVAGIFILKHAENLSDEVLCARAFLWMFIRSSGESLRSCNSSFLPPNRMDNLLKAHT